MAYLKSVKSFVSLVIICALFFSLHGGFAMAFNTDSGTPPLCGDYCIDADCCISGGTQNAGINAQLLPSDSEDGFGNTPEDSTASDLDDEGLGGDSSDPDSSAVAQALADTAAIERFVNRLYDNVLGRASDATGLNYWRNNLLAGTTGASVAQGFFFSREFLARNVSNERFVDILYLTLLDRQADAPGRVYWMNQLNAGIPREEILAGFVVSNEFTRLCNDFGIIRGAITVLPGGQDRLLFLTRMYRHVLGREPDQIGLHHWMSGLASGMTGAVIAHQFFFSNEFLARNVSNDRFLEILYLAMLNRSITANDRAYWLPQLNMGIPREGVLAGFVSSTEFTNLCNQSGIVRGTYTPPAGMMQRAFVARLYRTVLGREPDAAGLSLWTNELLNGATGAQIVYNFVFSREMYNRNLGSEQFVEVLYNAMLGRSPDAGGRAHWINQLQIGVSRYNVFVGFVNTNEFDLFCRTFGIQRGTAPSDILVNPKPLLGKVIILDPGHGTIGSPGVAGYNEAVAMLDLARRMKPLLEAQGARVVMIRDNDANIPLAVRSAMINIEALRAVRAVRTSQSDRTEIDRLIGIMQTIVNNNREDSFVNGQRIMNIPFDSANVIHPDLLRIFQYTNDPIIRNNFLVISLHSNATATGDTSVRGGEVYYIDPNSHVNTGRYFAGYSFTEQSRAFGNILLNHLQTVGIPRRMGGLRAENYAIIREINVPAVLAENGFHTNPQERAMLSDPNFRQTLAVTYRNAIIQYFQ